MKLLFILDNHGLLHQDYTAVLKMPLRSSIFSDLVKANDSRPHLLRKARMALKVRLTA